MKGNEEFGYYDDNNTTALLFLVLFLYQITTNLSISPGSLSLNQSHTTQKECFLSLDASIHAGLWFAAVDRLGPTYPRYNTELPALAELLEIEMHFLGTTYCDPLCNVGSYM
jgi:hypothetical protein